MNVWCSFVSLLSDQCSHKFRTEKGLVCVTLCSVCGLNRYELCSDVWRKNDPLQGYNQEEKCIIKLIYLNMGRSVFSLVLQDLCQISWGIGGIVVFFLIRTQGLTEACAEGCAVPDWSQTRIKVFQRNPSGFLLYSDEPFLNF